mmetsp:Transcript_32370/g.63728  ORF Transcript_32370/g.63728 Transcript_32370/m.63728 type:complete len:90 (-) Transcript_32370:35-304(-)
MRYSKDLPTKCFNSTQAASVRCCTSHFGTKVDMTTISCQENKTFLQAWNFCSEHKLRVCSLQELETNDQCDEAAGCGFDAQRVWTSTPC